MSYELHCSGIITGSLNCFCLPCNRFLQNSREAFCHIGTSLHCENLSAVPYSDKYEDQHIRKFKTGYYCKFCNHLMHTTMKVNLHIAEDHHIQNRGTKLLKVFHHDVIAFKNVLITECAWQGLIDNVCCICDVEFEDEDHHKTDRLHVLKVLQKPVKFGINDDTYRLIDDATIQCLTCNKLLRLNTMNEHFGTSEHLDSYTKCKIKECNALEVTVQQDNNDNIIGVSSADDDCNSRMNANVDNTNVQNIPEGIDINYETTTATCKTCLMETNIDLDIITNHLELQRLNSTDSDDNNYHSFSSTSNENNDSNDNHTNDTVINEDPQGIVSKEERENSEFVASSKFTQNDTSNNVEEISTSSDDNNKERDLTEAHHFSKENNIVCDPKFAQNDSSNNVEEISTSSDDNNKERDLTEAHHFSKENNIVCDPKFAQNDSSNNVEEISTSSDDNNKERDLTEAHHFSKENNIVCDPKFAQNDSSNNVEEISTSSDDNNKERDLTEAHHFAKENNIVCDPKFAQNDTSNNVEEISTSSDDNNKERDLTEAHHFAKENNIVCTPKSNRALCEICEVKLSFNLKTMNEHVKGIPHNKKLASKKAKKSNRLTKQTMIKFVTSLFRTQSIRQQSPFDSGYLINGKYYLNMLSFLLLTRNESNLTCLLCGTTLKCSSLPLEHVDNCCLRLGQNLQFITSEPEEFIREIKAGIFHCGFCHIVVSSWSEMKSHLGTINHNSAKSYSYQRFDKIDSSIYAMALPM